MQVLGLALRVLCHVLPFGVVLPSMQHHTPNIATRVFKLVCGRITVLVPGAVLVTCAGGGIVDLPL